MARPLLAIGSEAKNGVSSSREHISLKDTLPSQLSMFADESGRPEGLQYRPDFISPKEEAAFIDHIRALPLAPFQFGIYQGKRRMVFFGSRYDFRHQRLETAEELPSWLVSLANRVERFAALSSGSIKHALCTEYDVGAGIGWHRDKKHFDQVFGLSLAGTNANEHANARWVGFRRNSTPSLVRDPDLVKKPGGMCRRVTFTRYSKMNKQDNITALLLAIFQRANPLEPQTSVAEYLDYFEFDIDRLGRLLRFLGLAEKSKQCDLGWTPNTRLMRMIGERAARPVEECGKVVVTKEDRDFVNSIYSIATGDVLADGAMDATGFCCNVLAIFELLEKAESEQEFKATTRIKDLLLERLLECSVEAQEKEDKEAKEEEN